MASSNTVTEKGDESCKMLRRVRGRKVVLIGIGFSLLATFVLSKMLGMHVGLSSHRRDFRPSINTLNAKIIANVKTFPRNSLNESEAGAAVELQEERRGNLKSACVKAKKAGKKFDNRGRPLFYNDDYNFMYCAIPKVAATSWKRVLLVLQGETDSIDNLFHKEVQHRYRYPTTRGLTYEEQKLRFSMYKTFLFVREPFHRILSAYRDKFEPQTQKPFKRYAAYILKANGKPITTQSLNLVTFAEFVQYLIHPVTTYTSMDMHWKPMHILCDVCNIDYDFVGKFETLQEDASNFLRLVKASDVVSFPNYENDAHVTNSSSSDIYNKYYSTVPHNSLVRLYKKYALDFLLFGYPIPDILATVERS